METPTSRALSRRAFLRGVGAGALAAAGGAWLTGCPRRPTMRPSVVLITLDTTRADHLGCYGYPRPTSPALDAFAAEAMRYTRAISPGTWTLPTHASLFTGKFTASHGARYDPQGVLRLTSGIEGPAAWDAYRANPLASGETTLAATLKRGGYATGAVVGGPWLKRVFGLAHGFDHYDDTDITTVNGRRGASVTDAALAWLDRPSPLPRFLFLNYFDAHTPYQPPTGWARRFAPAGPSRTAHQEALYDAEIAYMDSQLGRLFEGLRTRGLYDDAWIVVTADHGELFGERGFSGHGDIPLQGVVRVPLLVRAPGGRTGTSEAMVQLVDLMPMLLDALGLDVPGGVQGAWPRGDAHPVVVESRTLEAFNEHGHWRALYDGDLKYVHNSRGDHLLFDLAGDPLETRNLVAERPEQAAALAARLDAFLAGLPAPPRPAAAGEVDAQTQEALKALGYVE